MRHEHPTVIAADHAARLAAALPDPLDQVGLGNTGSAGHRAHGEPVLRNYSASRTKA